MNGTVRRALRVCHLCVMLLAPAVVVSMVWTSPALAERRLAFVVGIDGYTHLGPDAQLRRAVSDAQSVSARLSKLGFVVTTLAGDVKVDQDIFLRRFAGWTHSIEPGDFAVFYFAGHGIGINNANYLVPADIPDLKDADEYTFRAHAIAETEIRNRIKESGARVTVLMLDACRNNPFGSNGRAVSASRGLQPIEPTKGVLTIYSAGYGQTALDRLSDSSDPDPNSVFTRVLLTELQKPGENLLDLSENIRDEVANLAQSVGHDQVPAVDNQLLGGRTVYFVKAAPAPAPPAPDEAMWSEIQTSNDRVTLQRFVDTFPASPHRATVEARLVGLDDAPLPSPAAAAPPAEDVAWRYLRATTDAAALRRFIGDYPSSGHQAEARAILANLGEAAWERSREANRPRDLRDFLRDFPGSAQESLATARLQSLDDAAWAAAANGTRVATERYLSDFPDGRHRADADKRLADLDIPKPAVAFPRAVTISAPAPRLAPAPHPAARPHPVPSARLAPPARAAPPPRVAPTPRVARRQKPAVEVHHIALARPTPAPVVAAPHPSRDVKAAARPADGRCFEVNGDRYCQ